MDFEVALPLGFCMASGHFAVAFQTLDDWYVSDIWRTEVERIPATFERVEHAAWPCAYAIPRDGLQMVSAGDFGVPRTVTLPRNDPQFRIIADAIERRMSEAIRERILEEFPGMRPASDLEEHGIGVHNAL